MSTVQETPVGTQLMSRPADRMVIRDILSELKDDHALFSVLASSDIIADDKFPFAYITMRGARPCIGLNYEWWLSRSDAERKFVLVHEGLHFMFGHMWESIIDYVAPPNERGDNWRMVYAYAIDLMVNAATQRMFLMDMGVVDPDKRFVWPETLYERTLKRRAPTPVEWGTFLKDINHKEVNVSHTAFVDPFRGVPHPLRTWYKYAEWLLALAAKARKKLPKSDEIEMHQGTLEGTIEGTPADRSGSQAKEFMSGKIKSDKAFKPSMDSLRRGLEPGTQSASGKAVEEIVAAGYGNDPSDLGVLPLGDPLKLKKAWTSLVRKWELTCFTHDEKVALDWTRPDPRFALVTKGNTVLPREVELEPDIKRTSVLVYLDFSGSCAAVSMGFLVLALTIPEDRFDVRFFAFGTRVKELTREQCKETLQTLACPSVGGGTDFQAVANSVHAEERVRNVFVITDGDADPIGMREPRKWSWLQADIRFKGDLGWVRRAGAHHGWITVKPPAEDATGSA